METIKINQSVVKTEQVEREITVPCFRREKGIHPFYVAIFGEQDVIRIFAGNIFRDNTIRGEWLSDKYEDITREQFDEQFKREIERLSDDACKFSEYLIRIEPIQKEEVVNN